MDRKAQLHLQLSEEVYIQLKEQAAQQKTLNNLVELIIYEYLKRQKSHSE